MDASESPDNEDNPSNQQNKDPHRETPNRRIGLPEFDFDIEVVECTFEQALHDLRIVVRYLT